MNWGYPDSLTSSAITAYAKTHSASSPVKCGTCEHICDTLRSPMGFSGTFHPLRGREGMNDAEAALCCPFPNTGGVLCVR